MEKTRTEIDAALEAAKTFGDIAFETVIGEDANPIKIASVPAGRSLVSIKKLVDEYRTAPERRAGTARLTTLQSFIDHVNRHKDEDTVLFAVDSPSDPRLLAVFDYNRAGKDGAPRFGTHRASYSFPLSDEWRAWVKASGSPMDQGAFAEFLEDHIGDVMAPEKAGDSIKEFAVNLDIDLASPQKLMTLSRGLSVNVASQFASSQNLTSGESQVSFSEEHKNDAGVSLRVPGGFAIAIPVFRLGDKWNVPVRLRYKVGKPSLLWTVALHRTDVIFGEAFDEAVEQAQKATTLPTFYGTPEAP